MPPHLNARGSLGFHDGTAVKLGRHHRVLGTPDHSVLDLNTGRARLAAFLIDRSKDLGRSGSPLLKAGCCRSLINACNPWQRL
jgi:hypothetical protein